jgi:8-oxo-dGTP diphosphatase
MRPTPPGGAARRRPENSGYAVRYGRKSTSLVLGRTACLLPSSAAAHAARIDEDKGRRLADVSGLELEGTGAWGRVPLEVEMTQDKSRKAVIRARMAATGEPYTESARRLDEQHDPDTGDYGGPIARARVAVAVLFLDEAGRVLLVRSPGNPAWNILSRYLRPHEAPAEVSVLIATEQLGITPVIGRMLVVDWAPDPDDGFPEAEKVLFVFDGGRLTPDPAAVAEHGFHAPALIPRLLTPALGRRVTSALAARAGGQSNYLEIGVGGRR